MIIPFFCCIFAKRDNKMNVLMKEDLYELYLTGKSRKYKDVERDHTLREGFFRAVRIMTLVKDVAELRNYSYLHYEQLKHEWSGYSSIRLSNRFVHRLIFMDTPEGLEVELIEIDRTHYGNEH